jgi:hypothetical protein
MFYDKYVCCFCVSIVHSSAALLFFWKQENLFMTKLSHESRLGGTCCVTKRSRAKHKLARKTQTRGGAVQNRAAQIAHNIILFHGSLRP